MNSDSEPRKKRTASTNNISHDEEASTKQGTIASRESNGSQSTQFQNAEASRSISADAATTPSTAPLVTATPNTSNGVGSPLGDEVDPSFPQLSEATSSSRSGKTLPASVVILIALALMILGISFQLTWLTLIGALVCLVLSWGVMWPSIQNLLIELSPQQRSLLIAFPAFVIGSAGLMQALGINQIILTWGQTIRWDVVGALGDFFGAFGQILVAMLALYVAWRQYVISRDLTVQQNRITQQQTIDAYFQGISDLVLDDEGLLEDWPQERIIAEARTAAILSSIDAPGKAKVIRFLSRSKLLTPLQRDSHLGRPMFDGSGGYAEDRQAGIRVINLGAMLANADLSSTDLRWTDLSEVNLIRAKLNNCDLVRANFSRTILYHAVLAEADLMGVRFFYGACETASPRSRTVPPDFATGQYTGAVVEGADFSGVKRMSEEQRHYCCRWGGERTRATVPGGCEAIPNCLDQ
ncbi:MAG: pentapeptide repeat-containing protein [Cyanobacteria bacterium P01_F01_bin.86]